MPLFMTCLEDDVISRQTVKISLARREHIKMYRIWMFATLKDRPTAAEREHITRCEVCGDAFRASLGVSSFGRGPQAEPLETSEPATTDDKDTPKAVA